MGSLLGGGALMCISPVITSNQGCIITQNESSTMKELLDVAFPFCGIRHSLLIITLKEQ